VKNYFEFVKAEAGHLNKTMVLMTAVAGIANGLAVATAIHTAGKLQPGSLHFREFFLFTSLMALFWYCKRYSMKAPGWWRRWCGSSASVSSAN